METLESITEIDLDKEQLIYRAEGNANLVVSLPARNLVLRMRKGIKIDNEQQCSSHDDDKARSDADQNLYRTVAYTKAISTLLGHEYTVPPKIITLKVSSYDAFNNWLLPVRPAHRVEKCVYSTSGVLYPDVAFLPDSLWLKGNNKQRQQKQQHQTPLQQQSHQVDDTFSVEIKPKQGWTFFVSQQQQQQQHQHHQDAFQLNDIEKCRYCCMQYLKLQKRAVTTLSDYCPIDLFSGVPTRMHCAIKELIKEPQNNFRLFRNGNLIYGNGFSESDFHTACNDIFNGDHSESCFIELILRMLIQEYEKDSGPSENVLLQMKNPVQLKRNKACKEEKPNQLPTDCILRKILNLQLLTKASMCHINDFNEPNDTQSPHFHIDNILKKVHQTQTSDRSAIVDNLITKEQYLIGATALDCSIMLTFQRIADDVDYGDINRYDENQRKHIVTVDKQYRFVTKATVMDLDPKTPSHYTKYIRQTEESHLAYKQHPNNSK